METNDHANLVSDCCVCGGQVTRMARGVAHITVDNKDYRLYYHQSCLNDDSKKLITKLLGDMVANNQVSKP